MSTRPTRERLAAIRSHIADMVAEQGPGHRWGMDLLAEIDAVTKERDKARETLDDASATISGVVDGCDLDHIDHAVRAFDSLRAEVARLTAEVARFNPLAAAIAIDEAGVLGASAMKQVALKSTPGDLMAVNSADVYKAARGGGR